MPSVEQKLWEHLRQTLRSPGIPPFIGMVQEYPQLVFWKVTKRTAKKGDPKVKCLLVTKRERWVEYLHQKRAQRPKRVFKASAKQKNCKDEIHSDRSTGAYCEYNHYPQCCVGKTEKRAKRTPFQEIISGNMRANT